MMDIVYGFSYGIATLKNIGINFARRNHRHLQYSTGIIPGYEKELSVKEDFTVHSYHRGYLRLFDKHQFLF